MCITTRFFWRGCLRWYLPWRLLLINRTKWLLILCLLQILGLDPIHLTQSWSDPCFLSRLFHWVFTRIKCLLTAIIHLVYLLPGISLLSKVFSLSLLIFSHVSTTLDRHWLCHIFLFRHLITICYKACCSECWNFLGNLGLLGCDLNSCLLLVLYEIVKIAVSHFIFTLNSISF